MHLWRRLIPPQHALWLGFGILAVVCTSILTHGPGERRRRVRRLALSSRVGTLLGQLERPPSNELELSGTSLVLSGKGDGNRMSEELLGSIVQTRRKAEVYDKIGNAVSLLSCRAPEYEAVKTQLLTRIAWFIGWHLFGDGRRIDPARHLCMGAGGPALLRFILMAVAEKGEGVLVAIPLDAAILEDIAAASMVPLPFSSASFSSPIRVTQTLQREWGEARRRGIHVRALFLQSPQGSTGQLLAEGALSAIISWCRTKSLHIICDESLCTSVHRPGAAFKSVLSVAPPCGQPYDLHVILDLDTMLGLKGSAVGVLYSRNLLLMDAMWRSTQRSCPCSISAMRNVYKLLDDECELDELLSKRKATLHALYVATTSALDEYGILHPPAEVGPSLLINLNEWESHGPKTAESLWMELLENAGVNLDVVHSIHSSHSSHFHSGGWWFRMCFEDHEPAELREAVAQISQFCTKKVEMNRNATT